MIMAADRTLYIYQELVLEGPGSGRLSKLDEEGWEILGFVRGAWVNAGDDAQYMPHATTYLMRRPRHVDPPNQVRQDARRGKR